MVTDTEFAIRQASAADEKMRRDKAAAYLQERHGFGTVGTLAKLAVTGDGPQFRLNGRWPIYTAADLDEWANARLSAPGRSTAAVGSNRKRA